MFFSAPEFMRYVNSDEGRYARATYFGSYRPITLKQARSFMRLVRNSIVERNMEPRIDGYNDYLPLYKWLRPWAVVPKLRDFAPPPGEYGVGVEVECGFIDDDAASFIADKIKNWKYVAIDYEGGVHPIEATFPPFIYSKMRNDRTQVLRYIKLLSDNSSLVAPKDQYVGFHVNVSKGGPDGKCVGFSQARIDRINYALDDLSNRENFKYFNRNPYGKLYSRGGNRWVEMKLFDSTTDVATARRYIHTAVALADLLYSGRAITAESVRAALEAGYNKE